MALSAQTLSVLIFNFIRLYKTETISNLDISVLSALKLKSSDCAF